MAVVIEGCSEKSGVQGIFMKCAKGKFLVKDDEGLFIVKDLEGNERKYTAFESVKGSLTGIVLKEDGGKGFGAQYQFNIVNSAGKVIMLMLKHNSLTAQSLLNTLASIEEFGELTFTTSYKNERTNIWVKNGEADVRWKYALDQLPAVPDMLNSAGKPIMQNGKPIKDDSERMEFFESVVIPAIKEKLKTSFAAQQAEHVEVYSAEELE